jgi:hypothetical protein
MVGFPGRQLSNIVLLTLCAGFIPSASAYAAEVSTLAGITGGPNADFRGYDVSGGYNVPGGPSLPGNGSGGSLTFPGDTGLYLCGPFFCGASFNGSNSGTISSNSNASSSFDTVSGTNGNGSASASAAANATTGSLRVSAFGAYGSTYQGTDNYNEGAATAAIFNNLTFNIAGASATTVTSVTLDYQLDGTISASRIAAGGSQNAFVSYDLQLGTTNIGQHGGWTPSPGDGSVPTWSNGNGQIDGINDGTGNLIVGSVNILQDTPLDTLLEITYLLTGPSVTAQFFDGLEINCGDSVSCDYSNTSQVGFILPGNVTLTSDSGDFLVSATPLPSTWVMLLSGFVGLGFVAYRGSKKNVAAFAAI